MILYGKKQVFTIKIKVLNQICLFPYPYNIVTMQSPYISEDKLPKIKDKSVQL